MVFGGALGFISCSHTTEEQFAFLHHRQSQTWVLSMNLANLSLGKTEGKRTISSFSISLFNKKKINTWTPGRSTNTREKRALESRQDPVGDGYMVLVAGMGKRKLISNLRKKRTPLEYSTATIGFMIKIG